MRQLLLIALLCISFAMPNYKNTSGSLFINSEEISSIYLKNGASFVTVSNAKKALSNTEVQLPKEENGRIRVRELAQNLNYDVFWNSHTGSVELFTPLTEIQKRTVIHGGGFLDGYVTSMKEALDNTVANNMRLIEVDIIWTSDHHPVLSHDWPTVSVFSKNKFTDRLTLEAFLNNSFNYDWTPLSFYDLNDWLLENPEVFIVTDVKERNLEFLELIIGEYPEFMNRYIPQAYSFDEYKAIQKMGFNRIIITLYMMPPNSEATFEQIMKLNRNNLFSIAMPAQRAQTGLSSWLEKEGIPVYVHTINNFDERKSLSEIGAYGFYSDVFDVDLP